MAKIVRDSYGDSVTVISIPAKDLRRGDVIRMASDSLWIEETPIVEGGRVKITARSAKEAGGMVRRSYLVSKLFDVQREGPTSVHHAAKKKSPAQLEREIAEALSKSGKGHRPSKLGGDYFTVALTRAKPESTNEWNRFPAGWDSQTRGAFPSKYAAYKWAREKLPPGAPFTIRYVPLGQ